MEIFRFGEKTAHIDWDRSVEMVKKFPSDVYANDCFSNVFRLACHYHKSDNHDGEIKIAYGFVSSQNERIYCAHAFFIDSDGRVIDPTLAMRNKLDDARYSISFIVDQRGYFGLLVKAKRTDLRACLEVFKIMNQCVQEAHQQGIYCIG